MMRRRLLVFALVVFALLLTTLVASAITDGGYPDSAEDYPFVGIMVAQDAAGKPLWRCSGTLLSPTVFLTAGHCTEAPAAHVEIWFDWDLENNPSDYPLIGDVGGTPYTHPHYNPNAFVLRDVGVVVLDEPYELDEYGALPQLNQLDQMATRRGRQDVSFTAVGYGLQRINPVFREDDLIRHVAHPHLIQINVPGFVGDFSLLLSNNHSTGGTCFGDSGGPNFIGTSNVVGGVTSFGINGNCAGTGGVFRMDRSWALDFVNGFLD